eukprot:15632-Heterococcus_DN1.PRE.1
MSVTALGVSLFGITYIQLCKELSVKVSSFENHKTENAYRNAMIIKIYLLLIATATAMCNGHASAAATTIDTDFAAKACSSTALLMQRHVLTSSAYMHA